MRHLLLSTLLFAPAAFAGPPEPRVRLISDGSGDKAPLRYELKEGATTTQQVRIETDFSMEAEDGPKVEFTYPVVELRIEQTVKSVKEDGTVTIEARIADAEASGGSGVPDEILEGARREVPTLEGVVWTVTHTSRGIVLDADVSRPAGLADSMKSIVDGMEAGMATVTTILPEEPVGVGATWEVESVEEQDGRKEEHVHRLELTAREGASLTLDRRHTSKGDPPPFRIPGLPEEVKVEGTSGEFESRGKSVERLDKPWWAEGESAAETTHKYVLTGPDGTSRRLTVIHKGRETSKSE